MTTHIDPVLADYLENELSPSQRLTADAHLASCERCRALTDDLLAITRQAAALGPMQPSRDLWEGIAARIEAPVVPIGRTGEQPIAQPVVSTAPLFVQRTTTKAAPAPQRHFTRRWLAAAASVLVATSVGGTYAVMRVAGTGAPAPTVAATPAPRPDSVTPAPTVVAPGAPGASAVVAPTVVATTPDSASAAAAPRTPTAQVVANRAPAAAYAPGVQTYDKEIASLRTALKQRADLDSSTVAVLERSLRVIDQAIAESRRALQRDPGSRLLGDQLTRALDMKVELLRTAVLLPSRS